MTRQTSLSALLGLAPGPAGGTVVNRVGGTQLVGADREEAAQWLADDAMAIRCGNSPLLGAWRTRRDGGAALVGSSLGALETYASLGFGRQDAPANADHLQGLVAELLWNGLIQEGVAGRTLVHAHSVKPDPLEPGGDGLVIYDENGLLTFRLWEIKKHTSESKGVSTAINRAAGQLAGRGSEYLAKLAGPETIDQGGALGDFYASIVELWLDRGPRCGVGVSVGTSDHHAPRRATSFRSITTAFPEFKVTGQTEAIVVAIPDFPDFAERVRTIVWSGL